MSYIAQAIALIDKQIQSLETAKKALTAASGETFTLTAPAPAKAGRKPMSEEAKARIREAQQRRWSAAKSEPERDAEGNLIQPPGTVIVADGTPPSKKRGRPRKDAETAIPAAQGD